MRKVMDEPHVHSPLCGNQDRIVVGVDRSAGSVAALRWAGQEARLLLGGALGVALLGSVFFGYLNGHSFEAALVHTAPYAMGAFALCGVLALLLPRTAVSEEALTES